MVERVRGRRGVALRKHRLAQEPMCRDCMAKGRLSLATVPDHIIPLSMGGTDDASNIRCLCSECHLKRSAEQFGYRQPRWRIGVDGWPIE